MSCTWCVTGLIKLHQGKCLNHPPFIPFDGVGEADLGNTGLCEGLAEAAVMSRLNYRIETHRHPMGCEEPAISAEWCWGWVSTLLDNIGPFASSPWKRLVSFHDLFFATVCEKTPSSSFSLSAWHWNLCILLLSPSQYLRSLQLHLPIPCYHTSDIVSSAAFHTWSPSDLSGPGRHEALKRLVEFLLLELEVSR